MESGHVLIDRQGLILQADAAFGRMLHATPGSLRGRDVSSLTAAVDRDACAQAIRTLLSTGRSFDITKRLIREDGSMLWVRNSVSLMTLGERDVVVATCACAPTPTGRHAPATLLDSARAQLAMIDDRRVLGDPLLLSGPNWATLLQVFIAEAEGRLVDVPTLAANYGHSEELVRRWMKVLVGAGLLEIEAKAADPYTGKSYRLTAVATERLEGHLARFAPEPEPDPDPVLDLAH